MRGLLYFIAVDLGAGAILTSGLAAFWLLCMDAANNDVVMLTQRASRDQRASEYVESIMKGAHWPSHGQLIVAQITVSEMLNHAPEAAHESPARNSVTWRAYMPLLVAYLFWTILTALFIRLLRRNKSE